MAFTEPLPPYQVENVSFDPERGQIHVAFWERSKNQSARVNEMTTLVVDVDAVGEAAVEFFEAVEALIDAAFLYNRNPPETIRSRNAPG